MNIHLASVPSSCNLCWQPVSRQTRQIKHLPRFRVTSLMPGSKISTLESYRKERWLDRFHRPTSVRRVESKVTPDSNEAWERKTELDREGCEKEEVVEELEWLEEAAIMGEDEGREPGDYNRRAQLFDESSRVFQALKDGKPHMHPDIS